MPTNYTTLVGAKTLSGSIKRAVNYAEIDSEVVLEEAQTLVYSMVRVREMRALWTQAVSVGDYYKALPSDFLDPIDPYIRDTANLKYKSTTETDLIARRTYTSGAVDSGTPSRWAIFDEKVQFDSKFDTATTLQLLYYKSPALLAGTTNETNFLTTRYPHVLRQGCVVRAHAFMKNWTAFNEELPILQAMIERIGVEGDLVYRGADTDMDPI